MQLGRVVVSLAFLVCFGCGSTVDLRDEFGKGDWHLPFDRRLHFEAGAPLIVLGRVVNVSGIRDPKPSRVDPRVKVRLARIRVEVENLIKGAYSKPYLDFYYYLYSPDQSSIDLGTTRYLPSVGQRRIYFLKRSDGVLRSVGDVTDYTLRVSTGRHSPDFCGGTNPGCCIAELLLSPGRDVDIQSFVVDLDKYAYVARTLCSERRAKELLSALARNQERRISRRAADVLAADPN